VPAGKTQAAFFVVTGTADGGRNDLAVTNRFEVLLRAINAEVDPQRKISAEWQEPPDRLPTSTVSHTVAPGPTDAQKAAAPERRVAAARQQKKKSKKADE
jgi:hypothetical protein